jgi:predicted dinucleotide-binding enzyme
MRVGILGTGTMASALAEAWARRGHAVLVGGRSPERAQALADRVGNGVAARHPAQLAGESDALVIAVAWEGVAPVLALAGAAEGTLTGKPFIDCVNALDYTTGEPLLPTGSAAERTAALAPGAHVVKALHLFPGTTWLTPPPPATPTVALCGDDPTALATTSTLIQALGATPAPLGPLTLAAHLESTAVFVMRLAATGHNPATAVPHLSPASSGSPE